MSDEEALWAIAKALEKIAGGSGGPPLPSRSDGPPPIPAQPRGGNKGARIFAICKKMEDKGGGPEWKVAAIGERVLRRKVNWDSRTWPEEDCDTVLSALEEWGVT